MASSEERPQDDPDEPSDSASSVNEPNPPETGLGAEGNEPNEPDSVGQAHEPEVGPTRIGRLLVVAGAAIWSGVIVMKCAGQDDGPALSVKEVETPSTPGKPSQSPAPSAPPSTRSPQPDPSDVALDPPLPGDDPHPEPPAWVIALPLPTLATYTVVRGGSMKQVANLFKIFHHEIAALNPQLELDQHLNPGTTITLHERDPDARSESVGFASAGSLEGGFPMLEGRGRALKAIGWKRWGTVATVALLDEVLNRWAERGPSAQTILVGNLSARNGGRLPPHSTHQSGRDVDLGYVQKLKPGEEHAWRVMSADNLDCAETWALLKLLASTGRIEVVFIDRKIQKLLYDCALNHGILSKKALPHWLEYPAPSGTGNALVQHVRGHIDHMHVRFECSVGHDRCKSRD